MTELDYRQLRSELSHWRLAIDGLGQLETVAAPAAWEALEQYLQHRVRTLLLGLVRSLKGEANGISRLLEAEGDLTRARTAILGLRTRYLRAETLIDFYGDAVNSRTNPALGELLRGYDTIAADSMAVALDQLGIESPPALVYVDKGLGAAILRAGIRLWDSAEPSPAAAIKLTRHNLAFPTALLHEAGHQVCALAGFNEELAERLQRLISPTSNELGALWASWSSEIAADVHAFLHCGYPSVFALANVVDGTTPQVYRMRLGDPHPFPWVRVIFNVAMCRSWYGPGPWDHLGETWRRRHNPMNGGAPGRVAMASGPLLDPIVDLCTRKPMRSFGGRSFADLVDPGRVAPQSLRQLEQQAGATLLTSDYLRRSDPTRILALLTARVVSSPTTADQARAELIGWVRALGRQSSSHSAARAA